MNPSEPVSSGLVDRSVPSARLVGRVMPGGTAAAMAARQAKDKKVFIFRQVWRNR